MIRIIAVRMVGGVSHQHISELEWVNPATGVQGRTSRQGIIDWMNNSKERAFVTNGSQTINVGVINAVPPYLKTYADGIWTDNLLALPRY